MNWLKRIIILGLGCGLFQSCNTNQTPDVSNITIKMDVHDFYKDFSTLDTNDIVAGLDVLKTKYPDFIHFYLDTLAIGLSSNPEYSSNYESVKLFLTHKDYKGLLDTVNATFPSTEATTDAITKALQYAKHYDDEIVVPENLYYFVSGLNDYTAVTKANDDLAVGLDYGIGENYEPYFATGKSNFQTIKFTKDYLPIWALLALYNNHYNAIEPRGSFIELAINRGKQLYFLSKVFPNLPFDKIMGYTKEQYEWAEENQAQIYNFFKSQDIIFDKNLQQSMRYLNEGPFSPGMPQESPGNIGSFLGYKIVSAYADKTNKPLKEILTEKDHLKIFNQSKYKPE